MVALHRTFSFYISFSRNQLITIVDRWSFRRSLVDEKSPNRTSRKTRWQRPSFDFGGCTFFNKFPKNAISNLISSQWAGHFTDSGFVVLSSVIKCRPSNPVNRLCLSLENLIKYFVFQLGLILKAVWICNQIRLYKHKTTEWNKIYHALSYWSLLQDMKSKTN